MISVRITAATHTGAVRRRNEDYFGATELSYSSVDGEVVSVVVSGRTCLAVVADGLGGHPGGDIASQLAVEHLIDANPTDPDALLKAFHAANEAMYDAMSEPRGSMEMGTTASAVLVMADGLAVVNVGDSAVFEYVDGRLVQLNTDDVPARGGQLPGIPSSVVTQTLGGRHELVDIEPHLYTDDFGASRRVLLCSDGLTNFVTRDRISENMRDSSGRSVVERLVQLALEAGGRDNVTVVLIESVEQAAGPRRGGGESMIACRPAPGVERTWCVSRRRDGRRTLAVRCGEPFGLRLDRRGNESTPQENANA